MVEWLGRGVIKLPFKYEDCDVYIVTFSKIIIAGPIFVLDIDGEFIDALSHDVFTELMELYEDFCRSITGIK